MLVLTGSFWICFFSLRSSLVHQRICSSYFVVFIHVLGFQWLCFYIRLLLHLCPLSMLCVPHCIISRSLSAKVGAPTDLDRLHLTLGCHHKRKINIPSCAKRGQQHFAWKLPCRCEAQPCRFKLCACQINTGYSFTPAWIFIRNCFSNINHAQKTKTHFLSLFFPFIL